MYDPRVPQSTHHPRLHGNLESTVLDSIKFHEISSFHASRNSWSVKFRYETWQNVVYRSCQELCHRFCCILGIILFYSYPSGLLNWRWGNRAISPVPVNQPLGIWVNTVHNVNPPRTNDTVMTNTSTVQIPRYYTILWWSYNNRNGYVVEVTARVVTGGAACLQRLRWWLGRSSWRHIRVIDGIAMHSNLPYTLFNTLRPRQDGCLFADDILKCIFLNLNSWIPNKILLEIRCLEANWQ